MKGHLSKTKILLFAALAILALSVVLAVASMFPVYTGAYHSNVLVNNTFTLTPNEIYREGLGSFRGGENITVLVQSPTAFPRNFSINSYNGLHFNVSSSSDILYSFTAGADYYDAEFVSTSTDVGIINFQAWASQPQVVFPNAWLSQPAKIMFLSSLTAAMLVLLKITVSNFSKIKQDPPAEFSNKKMQRLLGAFIVVSLAVWLVALAVNSNPLATFESWYTDSARDTYVSSLFLKKGFSVFDQPLGALANLDNSPYKYITWPTMPHLYPIGSIFLYLPFGVLVQNGLEATLVFKMEIALFLVCAHVCLYFFLKHFFRKDLMTFLKLGGLYIIYVSLVVYAANGMFDSVAFLFTLFGLFMFLTERYDYFFLLVAVSIFFKYQAGIFLLPLIVAGLIMLIKNNSIKSLFRNKAAISGTALSLVSISTAVLSAPFLFGAGPHLIMNGINAFSPNAQIPWLLQSFYILLTLGVTFAYALYMLNKNSLLSLSSIFLLLPSYLLPYFQNWYLPFIFVYVLIPQKKKELEVTMVWLIFMIFVLSFGGVSFNPMQVFGALKVLLRI